MNKTASACPPLTPSDIVTLRGKPMVKLIKPTHNRNWRPEQQEQEWVYPSVDSTNEEHYFFKDGYLVSWYKARI